MSIIRDSRRKEIHTGIDAALSDETRRQVVRTLHEDAGVVSMQDLAERIAATSSEGPATTDVESLRVRLHHVHLPKLDDNGLVDWDRRERTVSATDHPAYESDQSGEVTLDDGEDSITQAVTDDSRRAVLAIVESENGPVTREALAHELARRESDGQPAKTLVEDIGAQLHHRHLPKLAQTGFVEYDRSDGTVEQRHCSE